MKTITIYCQCIDDNNIQGCFLKDEQLNIISPTFRHMYQLCDYLDENYPNRAYLKINVFTID